MALWIRIKRMIPFPMRLLWVQVKSRIVMYYRYVRYEKEFLMQVPAEKA